MLAEATEAETRSYIATPNRLAEIDGWIEQAGGAWQLPEDVVFRARVCVAEILGNLPPATKPVELPRLLDKINRLLAHHAGGAG
jgi:hypothetical protein